MKLDFDKFKVVNKGNGYAPGARDTGLGPEIDAYSKIETVIIKLK